VARSTHSAVLFALLVAFALAAPSAQATTLTLELDFEFSGASDPGGTPPWVTATFDDSYGGSNQVELTLATNNLIGSEFVSEWYLNFDPSLDPTDLTITHLSGQDAAQGVAVGENLFKADGDGHYDIRFDFHPPANSDKFLAGEESVWVISYTGDIDVSSFDFYSVESTGNGVYTSAAHIQGIGDGDSGWIGSDGAPPPPVPEPTAALVFGIGAVLMGARARSQR